MAISSFGFGGSNVHAIIAGCVRPKGPPPRALALPAPADAAEAVEGGETVIEEVKDEEPLFPPEVRTAHPSRSCMAATQPLPLLWLSSAAGKPLPACLHSRWKWHTFKYCTELYYSGKAKSFKAVG